MKFPVEEPIWSTEAPSYQSSTLLRNLNVYLGVLMLNILVILFLAKVWGLISRKLVLC